MKKAIPLVLCALLPLLVSGCRTQVAQGGGGVAVAPGADRRGGESTGMDTNNVIPPSEMKPPPELLEPQIKISAPEGTAIKASMGQQSQGEFTIVNKGSSRITRLGVKKPRYVISIMDSKDKLVFQNFGAWSGASSPEGMKINWNTSANHIGEKSGPPFKFTEPGKYKLRIDVYSDDGKSLMSSVTNIFRVNP